jgi:hypothetical protein
MTKNIKIRNSLLIIISMLMISTILYSTTTVRSALTDETPVIFVKPSETVLKNANVGTLFNVNVSVANVTGIAGVEWKLAWNSSLLNCTNITENLYATVTPVDKQDNIWKINLKKDNTAGIAQYAITYQDLGSAQADGYAPINITSSAYPNGLATAILTFNVTLAPPANSYYDADFTFQVVNIGDLTATRIPTANQTGHYRIYGPPEIITTTVPYLGTNYAVTTTTNASFVTDSMNFVKLNNTSYKLEFNLTGTDGATAYVNVTIPKALMSIGPSDQWTVEVNGESNTPTVTSDATNWYLYLTTTLSTKQVEIWGTIPEFTMLFIPLLMAATLVAVVFRRRKKL